MKRSVIFYVAAVVALNISAMTAVALWQGPATSYDWTAGLFFACMGLVATLLSYERSGSTASGSVSFLPFLSGVLVSPSLATVVCVFFASLVGYIAMRRPLAKVVFNASQYGLATAAAVMVLAPAGAMTKNGMPAMQAVLFVSSAFAFLATNTLLVVGVISLSERRLFWPTWRKVVSSTLLFDVLGIPIIALLALSYVELGKGWLVAIVMPLLGLRQLYKKNSDLEKAAEDMLLFAVHAIEQLDPYTYGHSNRVANYARIIAKIYRMPSREVDRIVTAALLHDVGKINDKLVAILKKPGKLTAEEREIVNHHPVTSAELVGKVRHLREIVPVVRAHHERWDGKGYPDRLAGHEIPLGARIIALADTIDAMMSSRPYRAALEAADIKREIELGRGTQFDPRIVDAVLNDVSWQRLVRAIKRQQSLRPGEVLPWDEDDQRRQTGDMPVIVSR